MHSSRVDLGPYPRQKLDKIRSEHDNMLLAMLMEDYIAYMDNLAQQTNIMDKRFYVVIPYFPTVDTQKQCKQKSKSFFGNAFGKKEQLVTINEAELEAAKTELRNRVQSALNGLYSVACGIAAGHKNLLSCTTIHITRHCNTPTA